MGTTSDLMPRGPMTNLLTMDEKAEWIVEFEKDKPRFGTHRYQVIQVRRGQTLCDFRKDLGPSFLYPNAPPMQQAWLVPSAKFDPKLWPATGLPSHRELPKAKGLWQPDLDNAWQDANPVVPNFFTASFVTNANIVDDAGGSPERSS